MYVVGFTFDEICGARVLNKMNAYISTVWAVFCRHSTTMITQIRYHLVWPFLLVAVPVCGRFGLCPFGFVAVLVCDRFGWWPFRFVAVSVCGRSSLWPFRLVAVSVEAVSVCGHYDMLPRQALRLLVQVSRGLFASCNKKSSNQVQSSATQFIMILHTTLR